MKVLYLAGHEFIYNPQNGGQKCSLRNYNILKKICGESNIYLILFSNYEYNKNIKNIEIFPTHNNIFQKIINVLALRNVCNNETFINVINYINKLDIDIIFIDSSTLGYLLSKIKLKIPKLVFFHNIESMYAKNKIKHENILYIFLYYSYKINEKIIFNLDTKNIMLNNRDSFLAKKLYGKSADFLLPMSFDDIFNKSKICETSNLEYNILFVGSYFKPNIDGILWFINNVFKKLDTYFSLTIVGKNTEKLINSISSSNISIVGTVDDLSDYYYKADAVVVPIFYGAGMKVKTAEAMMYGKAIFATNEGLEGYDIEKNNNAIFICNNADEFISKINYYFSLENKFKFCKSSRDLFIEKYSYQNSEKILSNILFNKLKNK